MWRVQIQLGLMEFIKVVLKLHLILSESLLLKNNKNRKRNYTSLNLLAELILDLKRPFHQIKTRNRSFEVIRMVLKT